MRTKGSRKCIKSKVSTYLTLNYSLEKQNPYKRPKIISVVNTAGSISLSLFIIPPQLSLINNEKRRVTI
jgi:hypothetical protein